VPAFLKKSNRLPPRLRRSAGQERNMNSASFDPSRFLKAQKTVYANVLMN
jgi:hypothetical protein